MSAQTETSCSMQHHPGRSLWNTSFVAAFLQCNAVDGVPMSSICRVGGAMLWQSECPAPYSTGRVLPEFFCSKYTNNIQCPACLWAWFSNYRYWRPGLLLALGKVGNLMGPARLLAVMRKGEILLVQQQVNVQPMQALLLLYPMRPHFTTCRGEDGRAHDCNVQLLFCLHTWKHTERSQDICVSQCSISCIRFPWRINLCRTMLIFKSVVFFNMFLNSARKVMLAWKPNGATLKHVSPPSSFSPSWQRRT